MILSNTYELLINGQWQKQTDLEHVSLKDSINHPDLADVYTVSIWAFAEDMYFKQPKKDEHGYHFGTVNVLPKKSNACQSACPPHPRTHPRGTVWGSA